MNIEGLLFKLNKIGIKGKLFRIITNLYKNSNTFVHYGRFRSKAFKVSCGSGQGYSISGPLFNLFINGIVEEIKKINSKVNCFGIKIPLLLYCDDIIIFGEDREELEKALKACNDYILNWGLNQGEFRKILGYNQTESLFSV